MALNQWKVIEVKHLPLRIYFALRITDKVLYIMRDIFWHIFCRFDKFRPNKYSKEFNCWDISRNIYRKLWFSLISFRLIFPLKALEAYNVYHSALPCSWFTCWICLAKFINKDIFCFLIGICRVLGKPFLEWLCLFIPSLSKSMRRKIKNTNSFRLLRGS